MGTTYTRQSSFSDGDTITAALFNDEYNQLLTAFSYASSSTTGHQHDGTAAEGGNVHTIGDQDFLNKIVADSTNNRWGVFVEVSSAAVEQIRISDGVVSPVTDNDIDLGTSSLEFKDAYFDGTITTDGLTVSSTTNLDGAIQLDNTFTAGADGTGYDIKFFGDTAGSFLLWDQSDDALELTDSTPLKIGDGADMQIYHDGSNSYVTNATGALKLATETSGIAITIGHTTSETTVADNLTVTGNASIGGNFDVTGTLDFSDAAITNAGDIQLDSITGDGDTDTAITFSGSNVITVKAANADQITFTDGAIVPSTDNDIDLGTSSTEFKDAFFDGTVTSDAFAGPLTGDVTGNVSGTAATVTTAAQSNITSLGTLTTLTVDNVIINGTNIGHTSDTDSIAIASNGVVTFSQIPVLPANTIDSDHYVDGSIDNAHIADDAIDSEHYADGSIDTAHLAADVITGAKIADDAIDSEHYTDGSIDNAHIADDAIDSEHYVDGSIDTAHIADNAITLAKMAGGTDGNIISYDASGDPVAIATGSDGQVLTSTGAGSPPAFEAAASATTFQLEDDDGTEVTIDDSKEVKFIGSGITTNWTDTSTGSDGDPYDLTFTVDAAQTGITSIYATDLIMGEDSQTAIDFGTANEIDFKADNAARLTLTSSSLYPVTDNQIDLGTSSLEFKDAFFDGTVTADAFAGPLTGNVTGNASGTAATVTTAAQTNITSLGTLTALTVDDVAINGKVITMTGSSSDTAVFTAGTNGTLSIVTTDDAAAAANIQITADGTVDIDSAGVLTLDSGAAINLEPASGSAILLDGTISVDAGVVTGATAITLSGELDAGSLDVSGDADIDGTLEADAITVDGTTLAEYIADTAGAMVSSNTESGITVAYQDGDNTIDFSVDAAQTGITSLLATDIKIGEDDQTKIDFETADEIHLYAANAEQVYVADGVFGPQTDSDVDLGTTGVRWKDAFVDSITVTGEVDGATLDISGNADIDGTTNLDAVDIDGNVQIDGTVTVGIDNTGKDVKFFGATSGKHMLWDESVDALLFPDSTNIIVGAGNDMVLLHDGSDSYIKNATGALKLATETSGIAVSVGHSTSETTVNDNFTVTGQTTLSDNILVGNTKKLGMDGTVNQYIVGTASHDKIEIFTNTSSRRALFDANGITGVHTAESDESLKENIEDIEDGTTIIKELQPRSFNWIDDITDTTKFGFIAQEVESIEDLSVIVVGDEGGKGIQMDGILAHAVKAIQELEARIAVLEGA